MEILINAFNRSMSVDEKTPTNAFCLQRTLFELSSEFGQLYKYDNFKRFFLVSPESFESVSFVRFWQGVELSLGDKEIMTDEIATRLRNNCFVQDEYVNGLRVFRDNVLNTQVLSKAVLLDIVLKCRNEIELGDFWTLVIEKSIHAFCGDFITLNEISEMVLVFLAKRFGCNSEKLNITNFNTVSTYASFDDDIETVDILNVPVSCTNESSLPLVTELGEYENLEDFEDKYRNLLSELETNLPSFYQAYCSTKDEAADLQSEVNHLRIKLDDINHQHLDLVDTLKGEIKALEAANQELLQREAKLKEMLNSSNLQIQSYKSQLDTWTSTSVALMHRDLAVANAKCDDLLKVNEKLMARLHAQTQAIPPTPTIQTETREVREADTQTDPDTTKGQQLEREVELQQENQKLQQEIKELHQHNKDLQRENRRLQEWTFSLEQQNETLEQKIVDVQSKIGMLELELEIEKTRYKNNVCDTACSPVAMPIECELQLRIHHLETQLCILRQLHADEMAKQAREYEADPTIVVPETPREEMMDRNNYIPGFNDQDGIKTLSQDSSDAEPDEIGDNYLLLRVNPALAEIRKLNEMTEARFGHLQEKRHFENSSLVHRAVNGIRRLDSIPMESENLDFDQVESSLASDDEPDIFQNAAFFISKAFF
ncbi:hypothetical protein BdWA1_000138 [Babesia duncani]|uniref:Uncharacterized protein n=1 Tax=Babesia duncani TaxID=323732 RepID=A0AAD9UPR0_9APIC|nr:hypothetical protein BdWA1_000138 [Babesia duncani]